MKNISSFFNVLLKFVSLICVLSCSILAGCYSFTGGSVPEHLKTLYIAPVNDKSGFGNPQYRNELMLELTDKFRSDNSFEIVERNGDAKLFVTIVSINEEITAVSPGELADEKKVTVVCSAEYYDAVENKTLMEKNFESFDVYKISRGQTGREEAVLSALDVVSDEILLAVVSGW
jgi:hypothetical protein